MESLFILAWLLSFTLTLTMFFIVVYQLMGLIDLEADLSNTYDATAQVNNLVRVEYYSLGLIFLLHLVSRHWFTLLLCLPYVWYNVYLYTRRWHLVDVTEVFRHLPREKKQRLYKLVSLGCFTVYLAIWIIYCSIMDMD